MFQEGEKTIGSHNKKNTLQLAKTVTGGSGSSALPATNSGNSFTGAAAKQKHPSKFLAGGADPSRDFKIAKVPFRGNVFKGRARVTESWNLICHYIELTPSYALSTMPSGAKYSRFHIVLQMECLPKFYIYNIYVILFILVLLNFTAFLEDASDT